MLPEERILLKIVLIISLLGMFLLLLLSAKLPKESQERVLISSLEEMPENSEVIIAGTITSLKDTPTILILTLSDSSGSIKVIADKKGMETKLKTKMRIEVQGTLQDYKGEQEVQAATIRILEKSGK